MLHHLICHTYCGHTSTKLPFTRHMWKIISLPMVTFIIIAVTNRAITYSHHCLKCFTYIKSFHPHIHYYPHFTNKD